MAAALHGLWRFLGYFDELHLAVFGAVQDHHFAFRIAEDEDIAIFEMGLLDCFFQRHGAHGYGIVGANQVNLSGFRNGRVFVDQHRDCGFLGEADGCLDIFLG